MKTVMIVAGEASGEAYGARLATALRERWGPCCLMGIGGERMDAAGVELIAPVSGAFGFLELVPALRRLWTTWRAAIHVLHSRRPEVLVLIDFPDFNFRLGRAARKLGIPVLYYVSPQIWAWRKGRVKTLRGFVSSMAVILPFEEEFYRHSGITCEFVGHPIMEDIEHLWDGGVTAETTRARARAGFGLESGEPVVAILPGSRHGELAFLLPEYLRFVRLLKARYPAVRVLLPLAPNLRREGFAELLGALEQEGVAIVPGQAVPVLAAADVALVASGTATLQTALIGTPFVVVYRLSALTYHLLKRIVTVKNIALANIVAGETVVPELIQDEARAERMLAEIARLLDDPVHREHVAVRLRGIRGYFAGKNPSRRVAAIAGGLAGWE